MNPQNGMDPSSADASAQADTTSSSRSPKAASSCNGDSPLNESPIKITPKKMKAVLEQFATVFPPPTESPLAWVAEVWANLFEDRTEEEILNAFKRLMYILDRFPFPSDLALELELIESEGVAGGEA